MIGFVVDFGDEDFRRMFAGQFPPEDRHLPAREERQRRHIGRHKGGTGVGEGRVGGGGALIVGGVLKSSGGGFGEENPLSETLPIGRRVVDEHVGDRGWKINSENEAMSGPGEEDDGEIEIQSDNKPIDQTLLRLVSIAHSYRAARFKCTLGRGHSRAPSLIPSLDETKHKASIPHTIQYPYNA